MQVQDISDRKGWCLFLRWHRRKRGLMNQSNRRGRAWRQQHPLCNTSSFPRYLVGFRQWSQWQVDSLNPGCNQCQVGGGQAPRPYCHSKTHTAWPASWDFHVITYPYLTPDCCQGFPLFAVLSQSCHVFFAPGGARGVTVAPITLPHTDVFPSLSFRIIVSADFHFWHRCTDVDIQNRQP